MKNRFLAKTIAAAMSVTMIGGSISSAVQSDRFVPGVNAAEAVPNTAAKNNDNWHIGNRYRSGDVSYYKEENVYNRQSDYSLVIENTSSNDCSIEKTFKVEPYTKYRFSAMVKYSGYSELENPNAKTGASIGFAKSYSHSVFVNTDEWTKAEFEFTTKGETEVTLCLRNGMYGNCCKGKAYFSNLCLEQIETKKTNKWNILAVAFQQVDVSDLEGKEKIIRKKDGVDTQFLTKEDIKLIGNNLKRLNGSLPEMSDGQWDVDSIDLCVVKSSDSGIAGKLSGMDTSSFKDAVNYSEMSDTLTLTDLRIRDDGVIQIDPHTDEIEAIIEPLLKNKEYDHIIFFAPFRDWTGDVQGTGGLFYCDGTNYCQIPCKIPGDYEAEAKKYTADTGYIHELLHGMETRSKAVDPEKTANLHDNLIYGYKENDGEGWQEKDGWKSWYSAYMCSELTGGRGIAPAVYLADRTKYTTVVSEDMAVNEDEIKYNGAVFSVQPKTLYLVGEELDLSGAVISGTALRKNIPIKNIDTLDTSGFDNTKPGEYTIYADLGDCKPGLKAALEVQVVNEKDLIYGDVDCDGEVNISDAVLISNYLRGSAELSVLGRRNADVYAPGSGITEDDIYAINEYISGETKLPVKPELLYGDVNCDGAVDVEDSDTLIRYLNGFDIRISAQGRINADVYNPGSGITEDDIAAINRYVSGETALPVKTELLYGDVNCDGAVDIEDTVLLSSYLNGDKVWISAQGKLNADVFNPQTEADVHNPYSYLDKNDVIAIQEYLSGGTALPVKTEMCGDVNCDGTVDIDDSALLRAYLNDSLTRISAQGLKNADVYDPGTKVDEADADYIDKYISGNVSSLPANIILGDVDFSGKVDIEDYGIIHNHIVGNRALSDKAEKPADVNGDGYIDTEDEVMILAHINGIKPLDEYLTTTATTTSAATTTTSTTKTSTTTSTNTSAAATTTTTASTTTTTTPTTTASTTATTTTAAVPEAPLGDINNDRKINAVDASAVLQYYANVSSYRDGGFNDTQKAAADVNHDGFINAVDASYILSYYAYASSEKGIIMPMDEYLATK